MIVPEKNISEITFFVEWVIAPDHSCMSGAQCLLQFAVLVYIACFCLQVSHCVYIHTVLQPSSIRGLATPWTYFLHLYLSSVILIDSSTGSPVHVLMLSIQVVRGLPRLRAPGICLLYTSPSPRDGLLSRMPSSA